MSDTTSIARLEAAIAKAERRNERRPSKNTQICIIAMRQALAVQKGR